MNMNHLASKQSAPGDRSGVEPKGVTCGKLGEFRREPIARFKVVTVPPWSAYDDHIRLTQPRRRFDQCVEHRLQLKGRAADDLEHVSGGGLLLQRFTQFVEQARVLNGNDGLLGEIADKLDLLFRE